MAGNFRFVGKIELNKLDAKIPPYREGVTKNKAPYASFNMSVVADKSNRAYVETMGMKNDEIRTKDVDGNDIVISWKDREDPEVLKKVAYYKKNIIELDGERHEFVSGYDFVKFLIDNMDIIKDKEFIVRGQIKPNVYNGKVSLRYNFNNMVEVTNTDEIKHSLTINSVFYYGADDIDTADWKASKTINVNAYTSQYFDKETGNKYVSTPFVIDVSKANLDDEKIVKQLTFRLNQLGIALNNGDVKAKIKNKTIISLPIECNYINGNEEVPFDESQLTPTQKEAIELGINTIDDFKPKGSIYGQRITIFKYKSNTLTGDYSDGYKTEDITVDDFQDMVFKSATTETKEDLNKKADTSDDEIDALFN